MCFVNFALVLIAFGSFLSTTEAEKRTYEEDFNVLINLYKLNPLRKSSIFKSYYDSLFMPDVNKATIKNMMDKEVLTTEASTNATEMKAQETETYIRNIEKIIHVKNAEHSDPEKSHFEYNNNFIEKDPETFNDRTDVLNDVLVNFDTEIQKKKSEDDFKAINSLFEHVDSDDAEKLPLSTKLLPQKPKENKKISLIDVLSNGDYFLV